MGNYIAYSYKLTLSPFLALTIRNRRLTGGAIAEDVIFLLFPCRLKVGEVGEEI